VKRFNGVLGEIQIEIKQPCTLDLDKELLCMRASLGTRSGTDMLLDHFPFITIFQNSLDEALMLIRLPSTAVEVAFSSTLGFLNVFKFSAFSIASAKTGRV
jgi:hypothetical protein